ncbi:MAG: outer membrane protein assembly factor BamB family protein [Planctomycetota bacterium]
MKSATLIVGLFCACAVAAGAEDWPQFKGSADRVGDRPGEALTLPMKRILAVRFPAPIYASPAVVGGKVYVGDARGNVACVDANAGNKIVWTAKIDGVVNHSSPAVAKGKVFIGSSAGYLAVLDAGSGKLLSKIPAEGGVITSPAVAGGAVYFNSVGGFVYKADLSGKVVWKLEVSKALHAGLAVRGDLIAVVSNTYRVLKDEGATVAVVKKYGKMKTLTAAPAFVDEKRFSMQSWESENGVLYLAECEGDPKKRATCLDSGHCDSRVTPSVRGGVVYRGDAGFSLEPAASAKKNARKKYRVWEADCEQFKPGGFHSSPALAAKHLVLGAEDGRVYFFPLGKPGPAGQAVSAKPAWVFETEGARRDANRAVSSSPAVSGGRVFFGGEDGILYGLGPGAAVPIVGLPGAEPIDPRKRPGLALVGKGTEWPTAGGDMGFSAVSADKTVKPPFRVKWKTRVWSSSKSQVVVAAGKVYASARMGQLTALDAETGEIVWRTHHAHGEGRGAASYIEGKVLALRGIVDQHGKKNTNAGVWCHDAETGKLLWRRELPLGYHFNTDGVAGHDGKAFVCWNAAGGTLKAAAYALDDGKAVWERQYPGVVPTELPVPVRHACAVGDGKVFFAIAASQTLSRRKVKGKFGQVIAVDPGSGELLWKNDDYDLYRGMRMSFRRGIVAVFSPDGTHALDAATGKKLWDGKPPTFRLYFGQYYWQPLTDIFLDSKGQKGVCGYTGCASPVFANGRWYGHYGAMSKVTTCFEEAPPGKKKLAFTRKIVWRYTFLSTTCPSPSPAYGRLYHTPNGEGVVYCFEPGPVTGGR